MNEDENKRWLVPRPDFSLGKPTTGANRVLTDMVDQTLAFARQQQGIGARKLRIGQYEWCEPDYQQVIIWAKALSLEPEDVIKRLLEGTMKGLVQWGDTEWNKTVFANGRLLRLNWNFDLLPVEHFEWVDGLALTHLAFSSSRPWAPRLSLHLTSLTHLFCDRLKILELDLSHMPRLTHLDCSGNRLPVLDLSTVPKLTYLACYDNPITELALSNVPMLTFLGLEVHQLTELNLSNVPMLESLVCSAGQLTELDLTKVPMLMTLTCLMNKITKLKFSTMPVLTELCCWVNELTELDLSKTPMLTELDCGTNKLTGLDIRALQHLTKLRYDADATRLIHRPDQDVKRMLESFYLRE